jgi:hypothetical protein
MSNNMPQKSWYLAQRPPLAWLETVIKLIAIGSVTSTQKGDVHLYQVYTM